jgi:hypothetical protein
MAQQQGTAAAGNPPLEKEGGAHARGSCHCSNGQHVVRCRQEGCNRCDGSSRGLPALVDRSTDLFIGMDREGISQSIVLCDRTERMHGTARHMVGSGGHCERSPVGCLSPTTTKKSPRQFGGGGTGTLLHTTRRWQDADARACVDRAADQSNGACGLACVDFGLVGLLPRARFFGLSIADQLLIRGFHKKEE